MPRKKREVPWLEQRDNGVWYIYWYDDVAKHTKRESTGATDALEAQKIFAAWLAEPALKDPTRLVGLTVSNILDDYYREHVSEKVIDKARAEDAIAHLKAHFGSTLARDVDIPASRRYRDDRRAGRVGGGKRRKSKVGSDSTIRRELVVLQAAANHALRWKRITANDMPSIELPPENRRPDEAPYLKTDELQSILNTAPTVRLRRFIRILYFTAARCRSIETLTKGQIDLKNGRINLRAPDENALKKASKKRRPIVPIHPEIRSDIEQLLNETDNGFLWGDCAKMYRAFNDHLTKHGFTDRANPHILRHSRATHLLQQGVDIWDVAKLLGDTVATVERVYGHHCPDHLASTMEQTA